MIVFPVLLMTLDHYSYIQTKMAISKGHFCNARMRKTTFIVVEEVDWLLKKWTEAGTVNEPEKST